MVKKSQEGLTVKKEENFSEWYSQILDKAQITDLRYNVKGFVVIRPWGAMTIENMYKLYEEALQKKSHKPVSQAEHTLLIDDKVEILTKN